MTVHPRWNPMLSSRRARWIAIFSAALLSLGCDGGGGESTPVSTNDPPTSTTAAFPLRVAADGRHLEDSNGDPFLLVGDAAWSLMVELDLDEVREYLDDRRSKGFNTILVNLIERGFGGPPNAFGDLPLVPADVYASPNPDYFAHVDRVIDEAAARGMLILVTPSYLGFLCGAQGWCEQMLQRPLTEMRDYGRFLGDRYGSISNLLWIHGGDADAGQFGAAAHVNAIAEGIRERAPLAIHSAHCFRGASGIECYDEPWLDVNTTYSQCNDSLSDVIEDHLRSPALPFFYIEGQYENEGADLGCLVDQAAWAVLGGAFGHVFGNRPIWLFDSGWEAALDSPGANAMGHLTDLFRSRAWWRLMPDLSGSTLTRDNEGDAIAARTEDGETIMIHVPSARRITVNLDQIAGPSARAWWFDPQTGRLSDLGVLSGGGLRDFDSPGQRILVLDDASADLPAPATAIARP